MAPETKSWIKKYWQMVLIGFTLQILTGLIIGIGSIQIGLYQVKQNSENIETLGQSSFELQMNQMYIATKENLDQELPYSYTNTRSGK